MKKMYIKLNSKKIPVYLLTSWKERIKGFRFQLQPITYGICYPKKKQINTYFLCQNVDIVMTNKDHKILYIYPNFRSEKFIFRKKQVYYIYELPVFSAQNLQVGQTLKIVTE